MDKKLLKQLILISYKNGKLNSEIVSKIAEKLTRQQLKLYIQALKNAEKLQNVYIDAPIEPQKDTINAIKTIFPNKNILTRTDKSLLVGTKIMYNDDIFEMSLKNSLDQIIENIEYYD